MAKHNIVKQNAIKHHAKQNQWVILTIVLGALLLISVVLLANRGITGTISEKAAEQKLLSFVDSLGKGSATIISSQKADNFYNITINYQGQEIPVYVTLDGKYMASLIPLTASVVSEQTSPNIPKTAKPLVELYVYTYCPYGTQMEKAIIPAVKLLEGRIDFKIRQIGAMHGEYEKTEAIRQLCINELYPEQFLDYVLAFDTDSRCPTGDSACVATKTSSIYSNLNIDVTKIELCMKAEGITMYDAEVQNALSEKVSGSPTLVINGVETQSDRNPEAVKTEICSAFKDIPTECSQVLDSNAASAGFGSSTGSASTASC